MEQHNKPRLIGIMVIIALAIIFLPSLFHRDQRVVVDTTTLIPPQPEVTPIVVTPPSKPKPVKAAPKAADVFQPALEADDTPAEKPRLNAEGIPNAWVLQVGSFKSEKRAQELKDKLLASGHKAYARPITTAKGKFFRVFIGPYLDKRKAQKTKASIDKQYQLTSQIVRFTAE